jgi:hydroxymethylglutaryl-CoA synthase
VGKFSAEIGYIEHSCRVIESILTETGTEPQDYTFLCLHQPYASLPMSVARRTGFKRKQVQPGLIAGRIGNTYSSACLLSLCSVLDAAAAGDRIMLVSFGSGAGSDGFVFTVTEAIAAFRDRALKTGKVNVAAQVDGKHADWLNYGQYALTQGKLVR